MINHFNQYDEVLVLHLFRLDNFFMFIVICFVSSKFQNKQCQKVLSRISLECPGLVQHFVEPLFAKFVSGPYKQVKS